MTAAEARIAATHLIPESVSLKLVDNSGDWPDFRVFASGMIGTAIVWKLAADAVTLANNYLMTHFPPGSY